MHFLFLLSFLFPISLFLTSCGTGPIHPQSAPVIALHQPYEQSQSQGTTQSSYPGTQILPRNSQGTELYVVQPGDTLFSIAKKTGQDPQKLAIANKIEPPYQLTSEQKMILPEKIAKSSSLFSQSSQKKLPKKVPAAIRWDWPVRGPILSSFQGSSLFPGGSFQSSSFPSNLLPGNFFQGNSSQGNSSQGSLAKNGIDIAKNGIDILGNSGKPIKAAAAGVVVYSGQGLKGYGKLVIIKHNEDFLSAYAHNRELRVKEGDRVRQGQEIALMGQTEAKQVKLHFEIRQKGKAVNPLKFLPKVSKKGSSNSLAFTNSSKRPGNKSLGKESSNKGILGKKLPGKKLKTVK